MKLLKFLASAVFMVLSLPFAKSYTDIPPDFALQLIQTNFQILEATFNDPSNSFNIITNPEQRLQFIQLMSSSVSDLSHSLSFILPQITSIDNSFFDQINSEILSFNNILTQRVSNYLLPLNPSQVIINPDFTIYRLNQTIGNIVMMNDYMINIIDITKSLNHSLYDLSIQIENSNTFITNELMATTNVLLIKLSDLQNNLVPAQVSIKIPIQNDDCLIPDECILSCGIFDSLVKNWILFKPISVGNNYVSCSFNTNNTLNPNTILTQYSEFSPVSIFYVKDEKSNVLSAGIIAFICIISISFALFLGFALRKKYLKNNKGVFQTISTSNYQTV
jgi:hypothetical protein